MDESVINFDVGVSNPGNDDAVCLFCDGTFIEDNRVELWVQCMLCELWAHIVVVRGVKQMFIYVNLASRPLFKILQIYFNFISYFTEWTILILHSIGLDVYHKCVF